MWMSIEVIDGRFSARSWAEDYGDRLLEAALLQGATDWSWHEHPWGVVLEIELPDEAAWERFCELPVVVAALDAVPDPVSGLIVYRGRGGSSASSMPRKPRPLAGAGAAALPIPIEDDWLDTLERPLLLLAR